jgi:hypothetical protein
VTVIMPDSAAVASSVWFSDQNVHISKISGQLALGLAATAGVVTALHAQALRHSASSAASALNAEIAETRRERTPANSLPVNPRLSR